MTTRAAEVFEQVKALTADERSQLATLMRELNSLESSEPNSSFKIPDYAARLEKMFPNGPVIEDPQTFWDEARSERIDLLR